MIADNKYFRDAGDELFKRLNAHSLTSRHQKY